MKFVVNVNNRKLLLSATQVEDLANILYDCEQLHEEYVGEGKGDYGGNNRYQRVIKHIPVDDWLDAKVMPSDLIDTIKLKMKLEPKP